MTEPKRYRAMTVIPENPDPFTGFKTFLVEGYYVKYISATPYPISTPSERDEFVAKHTKHFIVNEGHSDWGMPRGLDMYEIEYSTLEEIK